MINGNIAFAAAISVIALVGVGVLSYQSGYYDATRAARWHQTAVECVQGSGTVVPDAEGYPHCVGRK